ncbi:MAG: NAD(P)H-binding protein [Bryobacteraceae bacterium]|nr:NAD(P)H-binding protein [Bryobacteraceae bacterium]
MRVLLAGASGAVGLEVLQQLRQKGCWIRTLSRSEGPAAKFRRFADETRFADAALPGAAAGVCEGIDAVISCLGASVRLDSPERRSYRQVDTIANIQLLEDAESCGVKRFVYVSAHVEDGYRGTAYIQAHEEVARRLPSARLGATVVRPTGIFSAFHDLVAMAKRGFGVTIGDGSARTNPIHQRDVARACVEVLEDGPQEVETGGPDVHTRREIAELAFAAVRRKPRIVRTPPAMFRLGSRMYRPFHSRKSELFEFVEAVATHDCIAPAKGSLKLEDYFAALAAQEQS